MAKRSRDPAPTGRRDEPDTPRSSKGHTAVNRLPHMSNDAAGPAAGETEVEGGLDERTDLEPAQGSLALSAPQDAHGRAEWEQAAAAVLRKARRMTDDDPDDLVWSKLTRTTLDGIGVLPLGTSSDLQARTTSGRPQRPGAWDVRSFVSADGARAAAGHDEALADLEGGATSLWLRLTPDADLPTLLEGVFLDLAPVVLDSPDSPVETARALLAHLDGTTPAPGTNLGADPVGARVRGATVNRVDGDDLPDLSDLSDQPGQPDLPDLLAVAHLALAAGTLGVVVDATTVHDLGATDTVELGYSMAVGATYLRALTADGVGLDDAVRLLEFRYAATDDQFLTIAKLRAARRLWSRVLELSGASAVPQRQHAVTSRPMMSAYDPHVNLLRTTVAAFAAGVGGADAVTVLPFDSPLGRPGALGRRMARNTSALLLDESHVGAVSDPAGGAYAVERLTDDLAVSGWAELGRLDESGGVVAALADGSLVARIEEAATRRDALVATRKWPITGLSEFPDLATTRLEREPDPLAPPVRRWGAAFEALRDDPAAAPVFLATMGTIAQHTARATFATNLLAAGGIVADVAGATQSADDLVAAHSGQGVAVLAGTDAAYAEWGEQAAGALRAAGVTHVVVAGKPTPWADDSCATGVDALAFLTRTREQLARPSGAPVPAAPATAATPASSSHREVSA